MSLQRTWIGLLAAGLLVFGIGSQGTRAADGLTLLNVSYDPTRELYQDLNTLFARVWKEKTGQEVTIKQSHGGSGALIARRHYRPSLPAVAQKYADKFPKLRLFSIQEKFGSWKDAQAKHFADGGVFDQIYKPGQ